MDVIRYELDNGIQVILQPHSTAPVVACNVWVGVGSADETAEEAGLAHVHEHMLFKGTDTREVGQVAREVEAAGGHINAFTSYDQTCYYVVMSSKYFDKGLDILSDVIQHSSFEADELSRELEVIQEEIKRGNDNPARVAILKLFDTAYKTHPYRLPVIGTKESVDSFTRDHVLNFYRKHYVPSNMTVVLVGDFDEQDARQKVEHYFGAAVQSEYSPVVRPSEPEQQDVRVSVIDEAAQDTHLRMGFHVPNASHEDIPALELLGVILGAGESSRLHQRVQRERQLVNGVYSGVYTPKESGLFVVSADYQLINGEDGPGPSSHEEVVRALLEQVVESMNAQYHPAEIFRARTILESQAIYGKQTIEGLAMKYGQSHMVTGNALFEEIYYERLAQVTLQDLQRVAQTYLKASNCSVVISHPKQSVTISEEALEQVVRDCFDAATETMPVSDAAIEDPFGADEQSSDAQAPAVDLDEDGFHIVDIEDGPLLIIQEDHAVEMFSARALTYGGVRLERPEDNGINALLTEMIMRGTSELDAVQLALTIESMASSLSGISGRNTFGVALSGLSKYLEPCLHLMAQCWFDATMPEEELVREKLLLTQQIKSRKEQLGSANFDRFASQFFGDHPYSRPVAGTEASIEHIEAQALRDYFAQTIRPQKLVFVISGDVDSAQVVQMVKSLFANQANQSVSLEVPAAPKRTERSLVLGDLDKNQAHVIVGFDAPLVGSEDRYALEVLHAILSGQGGRLFMDLRDKQSLAYSVYASMLMGLEASSFMINIGTSPEKVEQAVVGIFEQVRQLHEGEIADSEITEAKTYLIGNHDIGLQRASSRAMSVALDALYGMGPKRMFDYGDAIESVTLAQIQSLIERYLDASTAVVAITKPEDTVIDPDLLENL